MYSQCLQRSSLGPFSTFWSGATWLTISGTHIRFVVLRVATGSLAIHYGFAARQECTWAFFVSSQLPSLAANRVLQQEITAIEYIRLGSRSIPSHQKSQELSNLDTNEVIISNHTFSPWLSLDWEESVLVIDRLTGDWLLFINMVERKLMTVFCSVSIANLATRMRGGRVGPFFFLFLFLSSPAFFFPFFRYDTKTKTI